MAQAIIESDGREREVIVFGFTRCLLNPLLLTESQNLKSRSNANSNANSVGKDAQNKRLM